MSELPQVTLRRIPDVEELQRICDEFFDAAPISTSYAMIAGDVEGANETGNHDELDPEEQQRVMNTACRYFWLSAVRKRLARTD